MTKVIDKDQVGALWSISNLSLAFALDRRTISKRLRNAPHADLHKGSPVYTLETAARAIINPGGGAADSHDPAQMEPQDRLAWFRSEKERLSFEVEVGELVPDVAHRAECAKMAKAVVLVLETLPDELERDCGMTPQQVELVESRINDLRNQMAEVVENAEEVIDGQPG